MPLTALRSDSSATWIQAFRPMRLVISSRVAVLDSSLYSSQSTPSPSTTLQHTWTKTTSAPASASAKAIACPIPLVPPVTTAVCPFTEKSDAIEAAIINATISIPGIETTALESVSTFKPPAKAFLFLSSRPVLSSAIVRSRHLRCFVRGVPIGQFPLPPVAAVGPSASERSAVLRAT